MLKELISWGQTSTKQRFYEIKFGLLPRACMACPPLQPLPLSLPLPRPTAHQGLLLGVFKALLQLLQPPHPRHSPA